MSRKPSLFQKLHPAHKGNVELRYWRPDQQWYHPILCSGVVHMSRFLLGTWNTLTMHNKENWTTLFDEQGAWKKIDGRGLLSFSNHVSLFDDPLLVSNLGSTNINHVRWIAADHKNFFGNNLKGLIYSGGRCVPIIRGGGLEQPGFDFLIERLKNGEWVHIFPEGGRTRDPNALMQKDFKVGIGKLMWAANPVVMPLYHYGMHEVLPIGTALPKRGNQVHIHFGEATTIDDTWWFNRLGAHKEHVQPHTAWKKATLWTEDTLQGMQSQIHPLQQQQSAG